ncbi:MAG: cobalt ECF transporter T component CbiQ [Anaerolineae bacterium]|nr:cobalt ECF transporter T component CbiQ [Anaerolineae bacterium]
MIQLQHLNPTEADTALHRLDPRVKLIVALSLILITGLMPSGAFGAYIALFALMMAEAIIARVSPVLVVARSLAVLPFSLAAVTLIFTGPEPYLAALPVTGWPISEPGLVQCVSIVFKSLISVQAAILLIATTHFTTLLWAMSSLRIPGVLVAIISFMYRYLFLLADEAARLSRARDSRSAVPAGSPVTARSLIFRARTTGRMIGSLLVRAFERSERVYNAMLSRGYTGAPMQIDPPQLCPRDVLIGLIPVLIAASLLAISLII